MQGGLYVHVSVGGGGCPAGDTMFRTCDIGILCPLWVCWVPVLQVFKDLYSFFLFPAFHFSFTGPRLYMCAHLSAPRAKKEEVTVVVSCCSQMQVSELRLDWLC